MDEKSRGAKKTTVSVELTDFIQLLAPNKKKLKRPTQKKEKRKSHEVKWMKKNIKKKKVAVLLAYHFSSSIRIFCT